jgi:hypothetical protein
VAYEQVLSRRRVVPDDDPVGVGGFVTRSGPADDVMREFTLYQAMAPRVNIARAMPLRFAPVMPSAPQQVYLRKSYEDTLLDVLQEAARTSLRDFWLYRDASGTLADFTLRFAVGQQGLNRSVSQYGIVDTLLLAPDNGNLLNPDLKRDRREELSMLFVGGQGPEEDRIFISVEDAVRAAESPYNRFEGLLDSRTDDTLDSLIQSGQQALRRELETPDFTFEIFTAAPNMVYRQHWDLGDICTVRYLDYEANYRIRQVELNVLPDGESIQAFPTEYIVSV